MHETHINNGELIKLLDELKIKKPEIYEHSLNVAEICNQIGNNLKFKPVYLRELTTSALFHDIGKLVSEDELHPKYGEKILEVCGVTGPIRTAVYQHEERLDGTGYPEGISGNNILTNSRIINVVEVFANASYESFNFLENSPSTKTIELLKNNPERFDATIVEALEDVYNDKKESDNFINTYLFF